jgi:hypothetical protein
VTKGYKLVIRKNETGEVREYVIPVDWHDASVYWLTEGNFGCDCNRHACFERANGIEPGEEPRCGSTKYSIIKAILPNNNQLWRKRKTGNTDLPKGVQITLEQRLHACGGRIRRLRDGLRHYALGGTGPEVAQDTLLKDAAKERGTDKL